MSSSILSCPAGPNSRRGRLLFFVHCLETNIAQVKTPFLVKQANMWPMLLFMLAAPVPKNVESFFVTISISNFGLETKGLSGGYAESSKKQTT
jgi:hypothetical protein